MALPTAAAFRAAFPEYGGLPDAAINEALEASVDYYAGDDQRLQLYAAAHAYVVRRDVAAGMDVPDVLTASTYGRLLDLGLRRGANALPVVG